ncbi:MULTISPECIES: GNAT family N-acetyltransferase [unclassified Streptomyces]|uniref:GNAT family N-acetyltransferase n=1 Tax=unclassified Streptomyces TaxID=2593676 RepID=UPI0022B6D37C|nr:MULTISPECIES: GNAT family N-acetyltransferase [unclassified Streptomyces]MCZ7416259.1 GNAT family N-acetyltransferase [Streptomyces sp. WMMC897]MCZ7433931.1 GNAT family N-acetyltransferase [Streptomyces sp. WMMC1477]
MLRIREMCRDDVDAVADLRVRGWQTAYAGILPQPHLDAMSVEEDARRRREAFAGPRSRAVQLVADDGTGAVGWAAYGPYRGTPPEPDTGELYALYVRPELVGTGVGRALVEAVHTGLWRDEGWAGCALWVLRDNARARRFYEAAGYRPDGAVQAESYEGREVAEVRYHRSRPPGRGRPVG